MGLLFTALWWLTALSLTGLAVFVAVGDRALTLVARRFASAYVGDKFAIRWSVSAGVFELRALSLGRTVLAIVEPMLGMPMDLEFVRLECFRIELPWLVLVTKKANDEDPTPLRSTVEIAGLEIGLSVNEPEKWLAMREENMERFQQAIRDAAVARIAKVNGWTATVVQKIKDLATARAAVQQQKQDAKTNAPVVPSATPTAPPAWQRSIDQVLDSFAILMPRLTVTIRDDYSASGIGIALEQFEIGRAVTATATGVSPTSRERTIRVTEFSLFVNPVAYSVGEPSYVIRPVSMEMQVTMPAMLQSLIMGAVVEKRALDVVISFPSDITIQLRPMQLTKLLQILRPLSFHADWYQRALVLDESSCVELVGNEVEEYMALYKTQYQFENETGFISKLVATYRQKTEIQARKDRLQELEAKTLASRLLYLRSVALDWPIPSGGVVLPHTSGILKRRKDLRMFMMNSATKYVPEYVPAPMLHSFGLTMTLPFCQLQLLENTDIVLFSLFACDLCMGFQYALANVGIDDTALDLDFKIQRFGMLDERDVGSNVFRRLLDQNPGASHVMVVRLLQTGSGHIDLDFALEDLTLLVIFDPLLHVAKVFLPALNEDEATEMKYLAYSALHTPPSPEEREEAIPVYRSEVPQEYSPLLLGGTSLRSQFVMNRSEICMLGDSTTLTSHVLAFTTDMTLKIVSSSRHEAIEMELVDVALQPCRIVILDDAIALEIRAGMRTILEIEGEGVDLILGYKLVVGDGKPPVPSAISDEQALSQKKSASKLWGVARTALASKQIAEVEHEELKKADDDSVHSATRATRLKAGARRKLVLRMSDFAMNMSANDLGVLLSIMAALNEAMKEDVAVIRDRQDREKRMEEARKKLDEERFMERLKTEFQARDIDGGGTLDAEEIASLIESVANCQNLTKDEFDATVREFLLVVDRDGSGDVSLDEFESALGRKKLVYHRVHRGVVALTGHEYTDPSRPRSSVPMLKGNNSSMSMADMTGLLQFWERYEQQVGATRSSLNGIPAKTVQKKMVRAFKNYEYAQEAWNRLVNPSLAKPAEKSKWILTKDMDMGSRGNVIDQLLSSFDTEHEPATASAVVMPNRPPLHMFIQTVISTSFGGFYIRLIDENLGNRVPSIELSAEEVALYANFAVWEGELPTSESELVVRKRAHSNDYGIGKLSFAVYGKYYNPTARQVEPFMEYFPGTLDVRKDPETHLDIVFTSDRYFQLNVTFAFMEVVNTTLATFTKAEAQAKQERPHIKEEGGLFWMLNETGANVVYYVVAKKQTKDRVRAETVTAVAAVPPSEAHACVLLSQDEEFKESEQQSLKEKQLRQAFRNADSDRSGELDVNEVRAVLLEVFEEESKNRKHDRRSSGFTRDSSGGASSGYTRNDSLFSNDAELDKIVEDFVALADTDGSGQVSLEEFKVAIAKMRETVDRFLTLEIEGYEPLHDIPVSSIGHTQVYELTPHFEEVEAEKSIAYLYQEAVALLNADEEPTHQELQKAYACLRRVREMDPHYEWIDSYYSQCVKKYLPVLVAVHVSVDGVFGLQVKVTGAEFIRNDTVKATECLLIDDRREVSIHNPGKTSSPTQPGKERFFVLPPKGSIPIPLDLVGTGYFAIRQIGETEWSNFLPLSVKDQRIFKNLTSFEQRHAKGALRGDSSRLSLSSSRMVSEKMGNGGTLPDLNEYVPAGKEITYPSTSVIDNQPTQVIEKISVNDHQLGTWSIVILPQLQLYNVLPCGMEYVIVQTRDCPADMLDSNGDFRLGRSDSKSMPKAVSMLGKLDYFQYVNEINGRQLYVESGKNVQVFGLDLDQPALMKVRLCASEFNRGDQWSAAFMVKLNASRQDFDDETFEIRFGDDANSGPVAVVQQQWQENSARSLSLYVPYWIQNRSGLDFRFRLSKGGVVCPIDTHRTYFNGDKDIPLLANGPETKAMLSIRPFQETARAYESEFLLAKETKKYLPNFARVDWSNQIDMASVGYKGEFGASDHSFVVAYEVLAAPGQFYRSKIFRISPRVIIVSRVPRPLQVTPLMLDKKMRASTLRGDTTTTNVNINNGEYLIAYCFAGNEKHHTGLRLRDMFCDEALPDVGDWTSVIPIKAGEDFNVWTRGSLGDGPACNIAFQNVEESIIAAIEDVSKTPRYRIENRSTRFAFRYVQNNVKHAEDIVIKPLEWHSFVWDDPLMEDRKLKVTPLNWKIPTLIDFRHIGPRAMLMSDGLYSEVYIDGSTRVFAVGDTPTYAADRLRAELNDWLSLTLIDVAIHGFGLTIVDRHPQEVMNLTLETMRVTSSVNSRRVVFSLHHLQIDDMSPHALYPVVLAPLDSGFNSDKREGWLPHDGERPFFTMAIDTLPKQTEITIVNDFELAVQSMGMKLNLEYMLGLVNLLMEFVPSSDEETVTQQAVDYAKQLLTLELNVPDHATLGGMLLYFKKWRMTPFEFHLVFDSSAEGHGEGISSILGSTVGSIVGGIAHVTPEFAFDEIRYDNRYFYEYDLVYTVVLDIVYAVLGQWYKIVGSVEMLGDPVGLATDIVDGFALAARQFKRDVRGKSLRKGQSALTIVQTVVGAPMRSIGKVSNGLGDVVKKATKFESQEEADQPRHVPEGMMQGSVVFGKSIAYGVKGFVKEPVRGAKKDGFKGFAKGVGRGTLQLVASPFVGTLGAVEKFSLSVSNTTHLLDDKTFDGTRRPARDLGSGSHLKSLADSNVITEVELHVLYAEGLPDKANPQVVVRVYQQEPGGPAHDVAKYKSSTLHHTSTPKFDQSWLLPVASLDTFIEIQVLHKRKPVPKKVLGHVRLSMEDIYRDYEGVPAKILADTQAKLRLRRRKRVTGSILNELATASASAIEVRDESWRQRMNRPSMVNFLSDQVDDDALEDEDDYENDANLLSSRSIVSDQSLEIHPVGLRLEGATNPDAKIFVSIRYVNDMRRYA